MLAAEIGHNLPPSDVELLIEKLDAQSQDIKKRADELLAGADRCVITDTETAGKASLLVGLIMTATDTTKERQKEAKRPHFELANAAFDYFKPVLDKLNTAKAKTLAALKAFDDEQERIAVIERQRLADEARRAQEEADRIAADATTDNDIAKAIALEEKATAAIEIAQTVQAPVIRSAFGQLATPRMNWTFRVVNLDLVPRHFLMLNEAAIKAHIKAAPKGKAPADLAGVEFFQEKTMAVRR